MLRNVTSIFHKKSHGGGRQFSAVVPSWRKIRVVCLSDSDDHVQQLEFQTRMLGWTAGRACNVQASRIVETPQ